MLLRSVSVGPALALGAALIGTDDPTTIVNSILSGYGLPMLKQNDADFKVTVGQSSSCAKEQQALPLTLSACICMRARRCTGLRRVRERLVRRAAACCCMRTA